MRLDLRNVLAGRESDDRRDGAGRPRARRPRATIDGETHTAYTPRSAASSTRAATSASVASGLSSVWSTSAATRLAVRSCHLERLLGATGIATGVDHRRRRRPRAATAPGSSWSCRARRSRRTPVAHELFAHAGDVGVGRRAPAPRSTPRRPGAACSADRLRAARRRRIDAQAGQVTPVRPLGVVDEGRAGTGSAAAAGASASGTQTTAAASGGERDCASRYRDFPWTSRIFGRTSTR